MRIIKVIVAAVALMMPNLAAADTYLLMAREAGCFWCARWDKEIGGAYPKTSEGKAAPLRHYDLHSEKPDVQFKSRVRFTPTFVLVQDGIEVGRIEGYPGDEFFWVLLEEMLQTAQVPVKEGG